MDYASAASDFPSPNCSRYEVLFTMDGHKRRKRWSEGSLTVSEKRTTLFCLETQKSIFTASVTGPKGNSVFQAMAARVPPCFVPQEEISLGPYTVQVVQAIDLHLVPYGDPAAMESRSDATLPGTTATARLRLPSPLHSCFSSASAPQACTSHGFGSLELRPPTDYGPVDIRTVPGETATSLACNAGERSHSDLLNSLRAVYPHLF